MNIRLIALAALASLLILCAGPALGATANARIVAADTVKLTAPFTGTLLPFSLTQGDAVSAGEPLFALDTAPVYAPVSGTVGAVFAQVGDDAAGLCAHYGALAMIEPAYPLYVDADNRNAHDSDENRYLHVGETLYLKCGKEKGTGVVIAVHGDRYSVEIHTGRFDPDDNVLCYRESAMPANSKTGDGRVRRFSDVPVTAAGRVTAVHAGRGDSVAAGALLFELVDAQAAAGASPQVTAPVSGAVTALCVASGAQVCRGQLLCEIADLSMLELSAEVDELDIVSLAVGDSLRYTLDAYGEEIFTGVITEIRPVGSPRQNAAYFDVRVSLPQGRLLLPGMQATVLLGS